MNTPTYQDPKINQALRDIQSLFIDRDCINIDANSDLGSGINGVVRLGTLHPGNPPAATKVAVKTLRSDALRDGRVAYRLLYEVKIWSTLSHPNILPLTGFYLSPSLDIAILICPYEPRGNLASFLDNNNLSDVEKMALANVLINEAGEAVFCDFGLSRVSSSSGLSSLDLAFRGTVPWSSPELLNEEMKQSPASDIWAWGCLVGEVMAGRKPYHDLTSTKAMLDILGRKLPYSKEDFYGSRASQCMRFWKALSMNGTCPQIDGHVCPTLPSTDVRDGTRPNPVSPTEFLPYNDHHIQSLPRARLASHRSGRSDAPDTCFTGTRGAILQEIRDWVTTKDVLAPPIMWLDGMAGIGKSTIAMSIAQWGESQGLLGASFFFSGHGEAELSDPMRVIPTLAYQLAGFDASYGRRLSDALTRTGDASYQTYQRQMNTMIMQPFEGAAERDSPMLFVLDALDECEERGMKALLPPLLAGFSRINSHLRVVVTSRPEPHILSAFKLPIQRHQLILHDVEASVVEQDIRLYLQSRLADIPTELGLEGSLESLWFSHNEIEHLVKRSGALFIYAATVRSFVADEAVCDPRHQLDLLLASDYGIPSTWAADAALDRLYSCILQAAVSKLPESMATRVYDIIATIIFTHASLSMTEMEGFLGTGRCSARAALKKLHSVIITPDSDNDSPKDNTTFPENNTKDNLLSD
ncbi:hypothetical protein FRB97_008720, partial [Tulasnella sp. 331]